MTDREVCGVCGDAGKLYIDCDMYEWRPCLACRAPVPSDPDPSALVDLDEVVRALIDQNPLRGPIRPSKYPLCEVDWWCLWCRRRPTGLSRSTQLGCYTSTDYYIVAHDWNCAWWFARRVARLGVARIGDVIHEGRRHPDEEKRRRQLAAELARG